MNIMSKVLVTGGGAAGMMAALTAAGNGHEVHVYEKNEKLGKKLFITGKGRCNLTNACDLDTLFASVVSNPKFLYSAFYGFTNEQAIEFFEHWTAHENRAGESRISFVRPFFRCDPRAGKGDGEAERAGASAQ